MSSPDRESVNLPRWGLKLEIKRRLLLLHQGVNLPRWGLKLGEEDSLNVATNERKFTPLGFETKIHPCLYPYLCV